MFEKESLQLLTSMLEKLEAGFDLPAYPTHFPLDLKKLENALGKTAEEMQDNYPYFHPLYAGQMIKPPHPVARMAYILSLWINPNNHALDGGRASTRMEKKVIAQLGEMIGWKEPLGHLTSGGTMANLEALWIAGRSHPGEAILASDQSHYTHERISSVLQIPFLTVESSPRGHINLVKLEEKLKNAQVGTVVVTMGTTGAGTVDPLPEILDLREKYNFRIHIDAAYGGYFKLVSNLSRETEKAFSMIHEADSLVIDPHKHGLQPYGCGCILFKDRNILKYYTHDSPYTYYSSEELHLGEISLECSRPGASAVALWATHQYLPLVKKGEFANRLEDCRSAAMNLYNRLLDDERFVPIMEPELDIVLWAPRASGTAEMSELSKRFFDQAEKNHLYLSLFHYPASKLRISRSIIDSDVLVCLRSCLMKPEHLSWMDELWERIDLTMNEIRS